MKSTPVFAVALLLGSLAMPAPVAAAEGIECVRDGMTAEHRAQLGDIARLDRPQNLDRLPDVFTILRHVADSCAAARGWNLDATDDAMKYAFYQIVVAVAEGEGGIPLVQRQRADAFLAREPADVMERLSTGALAGAARSEWINRLFAAVHPGQQLGSLDEATFAQFRWLNMYLLFRHMGSRRLEIFRAR